MSNFYDSTDNIRSGITIDDLWAEYSEYAIDFCEIEGEMIPTVLRIPIADCFKHYIKKHSDREMLYCSPFREIDLCMTPYGYAGVTGAGVEMPSDKESDFIFSMYNPDTSLREVLQNILYEVKQRYTARMCQWQNTRKDDDFFGVPKTDMMWEFITRNFDKYGIECYKNPDDESIYVGKIGKRWI